MNQWFFLIVPDLPADLPGQTNSVEFIKYAVEDGQAIEAGAPVAAVRVGEAILIVDSAVEAEVMELPCKVGEVIRVGNPLAKLRFKGAPGNDVPRSYSRIRLAENQA